MPTPVSGELVRHHNQPFYAQRSAPKLFWSGCLGPILIIAIVGYLVIQGATTSAGESIIRGFILALFAYLIIQLILGGGLFVKSRSSLGRGLLVGALVILIVLVVALIGLASII